MCLLLSSDTTQWSSKHMVKLGENRSAQRQTAAQLPCALVLPVRTSERSHRYWFFSELKNPQALAVNCGNRSFHLQNKFFSSCSFLASSAPLGTALQPYLKGHSTERIATRCQSFWIVTLENTSLLISLILTWEVLVPAYEVNKWWISN